MVKVAQLEYTKNNRPVCFKWVNFMVCEIYLNKVGGKKNLPYKKIHQVPLSKSIHGYKTIASLIVQLLYHLAFY